LRQERSEAEDPAVISVPTFLCGELVSSAVLALWVAACFPKLGPKTLGPAIGVFAFGFALVNALPVAIDLAARLPYGAYAALFGCALPCFFGAFLGAAWLLRVLAGAVGGSNGGGGIRVPAAAGG
jgi:hypothetical protein